MSAPLLGATVPAAACVPLAATVPAAACVPLAATVPPGAVVLPGAVVAELLEHAAAASARIAVRMSRLRA